jgi:ComF family protein
VVVKGFCLFLIDCIFPRKCVSCGRFTGGSLVCDECRGRFVPAGTAGLLPETADRHVLSPFFTSAVLLDVVRFLKFEGGTAAAGWLGHVMSASLRPYSGRLDDPVIVPVPLHWTRLLRRGYDQAGLLAGVISRDSGIPLYRKALVRKKRTRAQSSLERGERKGNMAGAFRVRSAAPLRGRDIILIDDLVTTGETASACCRALDKADPSSITILCAGRKRAGKN